jgi:two-component system OmpR family response regulator
MSLNLLVIEDDAALAASLADELRGFGHRVALGADGKQALSAVASEQFDALILDRMLPQVDGMTVLERLRRENVTLPIIMLSALGRSVEKVEGLQAGADDYVAKPVSAAELEARVLAVLRGRQWTVSDSDTLRAGDIVVSPGKYRAWRAGKPLDLGKVELNLLAELVRNADSVLTRAMLTERVWQYDFEPASNIVDAYIRRLRVKLTADGGHDPIETMRGVGYLLRAAGTGG